MLKRMLAALLISVVTASACAPRTRMSRLPQPGEPSTTAARNSVDAWRDVAKRMPPGSSVRVLLADGTRMRAVLLSADDTSLLVKRRTRVPEPERRIAYGELELLETDTGGGIGAGKAAAIGIAAGAAAFLTLMMIAFAVVSDEGPLHPCTLAPLPLCP